MSHPNFLNFMKLAKVLESMIYIIKLVDNTKDKNGPYKKKFLPDFDVKFDLEGTETEN